MINNNHSITFPEIIETFEHQHPEIFYDIAVPKKPYSYSKGKSPIASILSVTVRCDCGTAPLTVATSPFNFFSADKSSPLSKVFI